jgi:KUP system potassium uptake protein
MNVVVPHQAQPPTVSARLSPLVMGALGVVYGDIGTSPLYTMKTALAWGGGATPQVALGMLSLIIWTLIIITSVKYVALIMRADNEGEGGILALMSLLGLKDRERPMIIGLGILGAALLYGDGAITPSISVLSALEGLEAPFPAVTRLVMPMAVVILLILFALQSRGTATIGRLFGPVMLAWFLVIGLLGLSEVLVHPTVLWALDPRVGLAYLGGHGLTGLTVLGAVFLSVTGAEALYADMGHFGALPIRIGWYGLVLPCLVLCYAGQAAVVVEGKLAAGDNPFFALLPPSLLLPMVLLSTVATVIASQSIISGVFSMTRQAIQLGLLPRMTITQTSDQGYGQIYVGAVNWMLMILTLGLTIGFGSSDRLAAAFGIAVAMTMLLTTLLMYALMREIWRWNRLGCLAVAGSLALVDFSFVCANLIKLFDGGWVPLITAATIFLLMNSWHRGRLAVLDYLKTSSIDIAGFIASTRKLHRVPGTAVYLSRRQGITPVALLHNIKHFHVLHQRNLIVHVVTEHVPRLTWNERVSVTDLGLGFWAIDVHYGFMEHPNLPKVLQHCVLNDLAITMADTTFFLSHETIGRAKKSALDPITHRLSQILNRNAGDVSSFFKIPVDRMVEVGASFEI